MKNQKNRDIRIYIVDDHQIVCESLTALLKTVDGFSVIASSQNFSIKSIIESKPDVVIMDIKLMLSNGIDATEEIKHLNSDIKVLMLSGYCNQNLIASAIKAGASGYLKKATDRKTLTKALRSIIDSDSFFIEEDLKETYDEIVETLGLNPPGYSLTKRERDILILIAGEALTKEIAEKLSISEKTVRNHKSNIMHKLDIKSDAGLIKYAYNMALI